MFRPIFYLIFNFIEHILKNQYDINKMKGKKKSQFMIDIDAF